MSKRPIFKAEKLRKYLCSGIFFDFFYRFYNNRGDFWTKSRTIHPRFHHRVPHITGSIKSFTFSERQSNYFLSIRSAILKIRITFKDFAQNILNHILHVISSVHANYYNKKNKKFKCLKKAISYSNLAISKKIITFYTYYVLKFEAVDGLICQKRTANANSSGYWGKCGHL